jgi:hypothetical protein
MPDSFDASNRHGGERLIFVGGAPRSGTTLVQNMLDCHPEILGVPEFLHLPDIVSLRATLLRSFGEERSGAERLDTLVRELILRFLLPVWQREGKPYLSEKTPENVLVFDELADLFPNSRFLFVLRDPRATVASMLEVARRAREQGLRPASFTSSLEAATEHAHRCIQSGLRAAERRPQRVCVVAYEQLVTDVEMHTRRICDFLGLSWTPEMLDPSAKRHLGEDAITQKSNEIWYDAKSYARDPDTDLADKWRRQLAPREQRAIVLAFSDLPQLHAFGYGQPRA